MERDDEYGEEPSGPRVVMSAEGGMIAVKIDPPLPSGDHWRDFSFKDCAWSYARELWCEFRLGFLDTTTFRSGQTWSTRKPSGE